MFKAGTLLIALLIACTLRADIPVPPDPDMELDSSSADPLSAITFNADAAGGGINFFTNNTNNTWIALTITFPETANVNCLQSDLFAFCTATSTSIKYFGVGDQDPNNNALRNKAFGPDPDGDGDFFHGIAPGQSFLINLNNGGSQTDGGGWAANELFMGFATAVPEPASGGLALACIVLSLALTRRRKS